MQIKPISYYQETLSATAIGLHMPGAAPASITAASNAAPIVITSAAHGLLTGAIVLVEGVGGNTAANGNWIITKVDANSFSLNGSTGNAAYTSGGTWRQLPAGVLGVLLRAEAQNVRWRDDGTAPTATVGQLMLPADPPYLYTGDPTKIHFIQATAGAILNVTYYGSPS